MDADWPLQEVRRLQARLAASTKPRKLHKYLRRLSALPMTADLLAHTRVRKTVKALRRYEIVGSVARDLAAQWKKLARAQPSPGQAQQDSPPSHSRKRPWAALDEDPDDEREEEEDEEEKEEEEDQEEEENKEDQEENEEDQEENVEEDQEKEDQEEEEDEEEEEEEDQEKEENEEDEEEEDKEEEQADRGAPEPGTAVGSQPAKPAHGRKRPRRLSELQPRTLESPWRPHQALPRSARPAQEWADTCTWHEEDPDPDPAAGLRQPAHGPARAPHHGAGPLPEAPREEAQGKAALSQGQTHKWTPRENGPLRAKAGEAPPASLGQLSARGVSREENGAKGKPPASGRPRTPLWSLPQLAADEPGKAKRKEPQASRAEKTRQHPQSSQLRPGPEDPRPGLQHISTHVEAAHAHLAAPALASASGGLLPQAEAQPACGGGGGGGQELPHQPTMSFEAYMTYDHLEKKQRKAGRPWAAALRGKGPQPAEPPRRGPGAHWLQKCPEGTHGQQGKLQPAGAHAAKLQDSAPAAAPSTQARDWPSHPMPSCPPRTEAPSAAQQEEDAGLSGGRIHPKMQVYAGAKHATPRMPESPMCIPGLEPIASPSAGRGVPPSLPGPLPEQHTPEELQRGERDNPELLEETDPLWKRHCHRDFQGEQPAGQESWRQMDLRLQSARERCLQALTAAIPSTHASKPKGRPTKRIRFHGLPGPAGDAPGRQDALQTGGASAPRAPGPAGSDRAPSCSTQHSDSSLSPPPAHRPAQLGPSTRLAPWAPGGTTRKQVPPGGSTRKQAPKKIAPLMAKSIRHYKKTLSRR